MSNAIIYARIRSDGTVVEILEDGAEKPFPKTPMSPMTEEQISAAAAADPDARSMTAQQLAKVKRLFRVRTYEEE